MRRVGLNEFVVEKDGGWFRNKVEQCMGIWDVWDFCKLGCYQEFAQVSTISNLLLYFYYHFQY